MVLAFLSVENMTNIHYVNMNFTGIFMDLVDVLVKYSQKCYFSPI